MKKKQSLMECRGIDEVAVQKRDHVEWGDFSILTDGHTVWLGEQKLFESPTQKFQIPKGKFDRLIRKYIEPAE